MIKMFNIKPIKAITTVVFAVLFLLFLVAPNTHARQLPSVTTHSATEIGAFSARLYGQFDPHGIHTNGWFEWGTTSNLGNTTATTSGSSPRRFESNLSDLLPGTKYYFRAVAENTHGRQHGQIWNFTTKTAVTARGELRCERTTIDSIIIGYSFSEGRNVSLFREETRINGWSGFNASGLITDTKLNKNTSYNYHLRNGIFSTSPLIASVVCRTGVVKENLFDDISIGNFVRRVNDNDWRESITIAPGGIVEFRIEVRSIGSAPANNVIVKNIFPDRIDYHGNTKLDGSPLSGNIETGINIGNIPAGGMRVVTFQGKILPEDSFGVGSTNLVNSAFASAGRNSVNDTAGVFVVKGVVAGVATKIETGITDNKLIDFIFLPLILTAIIFLLFKKHFSGLAEWLENKKDIGIERKAKKRLDEMRDLIKLKEGLN